MSKIVTPALFEIQQGLNLLVPQWAYDYASRVLSQQGTEPLKAFVDTETQRFHYVIARDFWRRVLSDDERTFGGIVIDLCSAEGLNSTANVMREEDII